MPLNSGCCAAPPMTRNGVRPGGGSTCQHARTRLEADWGILLEANHLVGLDRAARVCKVQGLVPSRVDQRPALESHAGACAEACSEWVAERVPFHSPLSPADVSPITAQAPVATPSVQQAHQCRRAWTPALAHPGRTALCSVPTPALSGRTCWSAPINQHNAC